MPVQKAENSYKPPFLPIAEISIRRCRNPSLTRMLDAMSSTSKLMAPGELWSRVLERTQHALSCGALSPIETEQEAIEDGGVRFAVRRVSTLARKAEQRSIRSAKRASAGGARNDFPIEPDLFVADVSDTHVAVLNKFPVIPHHLLLVTRRYVSQEALLDADDFDALGRCMREYDSLGFYNGGVQAGASQPHKHLQLVPLPLAGNESVPMERLFERVPSASGINNVPGLPFRHAFSWLDSGSADAGAILLRTYRTLLSAAGIEGIERDDGLHQSQPYNLLVTRKWVLVVVRSREHFEGISINALGYAGSIFVKSEAELDRVRRAGPMAVLTAVAIRRAA